MLGFCFLGMARAEEPARYDLDLNRPPPKPGEVTERIIRVLSTNSNTNLAQGRDEITNLAHSFELRVREKVLTWDVSNDFSKVEMTIERFKDNQDGHTNELAKPGTRLTGTSILGEAFFRTESGDLSAQGYEQLQQFYHIRPRDFNLFARSQIPRQISVGATWNIPAPTNLAQMAGFFGAAFTNNTRVTGQFVGVTNLFDLDCFHLRYHAVATELPEPLRNLMTHGMPVTIKAHVNLTIDLDVPFDTAKFPLLTSYSMDFAMAGDLVTDGKTALSTRGRTTLEVMSEYRPISISNP